MEQSIFNNSNGLAIYQVISFIIFFLMFIGVIIWVFRMDKAVVRKMQRIPFDENTNDDIIFDGSNKSEGEEYENK